MLSATISLTPALATVLFIIAVIAGTRYRGVWKAKGPRWQLWLLGLIAGGCLLAVAMIPVRV